jgi:mRNA interferase RelE/StbE
MSYRVLIYPSAQKSLETIVTPAYEAVKDAMLQLGIDPRPHGCVKLIDRDAWRVRIGAYRVIYEIDDAQQTVTITNLGHRRDVYRR